MRIKHIKNGNKEIDVENKVNIAITGANGVGKSFFLEQLMNHHNNICVYSHKFNTDVVSYGKDKYGYQIEGSFEKGKYISFESQNDMFKIISKIDEEGIELLYSIRLQKEDGNYTDINAINVQSLNQIINRHVNDKFKVLETRVVNLFNKMSSETTSKIISDNGEYSNNKISKFGYVRLKRAIEGFLNGKTIYGIKNGFFMLKDLDGEIKQFSKILSDGEKILFAIAADLLEVEETKGVVYYIWDEPENHLNPSWQRKIIGFINSISNNTQIIFVTHSTHILNAMAIQPNSIILELSRDEIGMKLKETNFFDNEKLMGEHKFKIKQINVEEISDKSVILVEGESDKILLGSILDKEKYYIYQCAGESKIVPIFDIFTSIMPLKKIVAVFDNDNVEKSFNRVRTNEITTFKTQLPDLGDKAAIEKYFQNIKIKSEDFLLISSKNLDENISNIRSTKEKKMEEKNIKDMIEKYTFLFSDKASIVGGEKLPSKIEFANYLINNHKDEVKEALKPLINKIYKLTK